MPKKRDSLKDEMIENAIVIINSVDWLGKEVEKVLAALEKEENKPEYEQDADTLDALTLQMKILYNKLTQENKNMDAYMEKYGALIKKNKKPRKP